MISENEKKNPRGAGRKPKRIDYSKFCECLNKFKQGEWDIDDCARYCGAHRNTLGPRMLAAYEYEKKKANPQYITEYSAGIPKNWFTEESIQNATVVKVDTTGRIMN